MNGRKKQPQLVGIDTNLFIYYYQADSRFGPLTKPFFEKLAAGQLKALTSIITLTELLSLHADEKDINILQEQFFTTKNLTMYNVTPEIAIEAAAIRREYGFRLPDAIQLATSLVYKAEIFLTNDTRLKSFKKLRIAFL
jgi:predicted nucleic acid-binding protein